MISRRTLVALAAASLAGAAVAQPQWPAGRPITIIVPFSAGGSVDASARLLATRLGERLKQSVVVENVAGAGGAIGVAKAAASAPDGYTLVMGADSPIAIARLVNPAAVKYDAMKDLAPVGLVNTAPMVLVAHPSLPAKNLSELVALARKQPGKLSYATSGIGTLPHLATEMLKQAGQVHMVHIPYRGGSQIANDVAGNQVDLAMLIAASALPFVQSKALKPIAVTGAHRLALFPDVPAAAETPGFKGYEVVSWAGIYAPANTPPGVVARMAREVDEVMKMPDVRRSLAQAGALPGGGTSADFARFIEQDRARFTQAIQAGISLRE